jgi:hypothetical protein
MQRGLSNQWFGGEGADGMPLWKLLLIALIVVPPLVWGCDRVQMIHWVGRTDLQGEFAITNSATGAPISGARVEIQQSEGGFYEDQDEKEFVLVSGGDGLAGKECRHSMCFGTRSGLGFTDTFGVHLPDWRFRVVAPGYESGKWTELVVPQYSRQARWAGPGKAKLVVPVSLHAERGAAPDTGRV